MPVYEYRCLKCEKIHEAIQKFSDAPLTECPECKGELTKIMSLSSFSLKGSGWYTTDYKRSSHKESGKEAQTKTENSDTSSASKSEPAKSESKATGPSPSAAS